jgi:uncharacterized membrane protein
MKLFTMLLAGAVLFGGWTGCSGDDEEDELPEVDCDTGAVPTFDEVTAFDKCASCHDSAKTGAARMNAPTAINFDSYDGAEPHATKAAEEVNEGAMPPANSGITLTASEKETLYRWALCGAME